MRKNVILAIFCIVTLCLLVSCQEKQSHNRENSDTSTKNGDSSVFDVQNGKLIGYSGEETVIALPESVSEITSDSFKNRKESIVSIRIGENVMRIADDTFVGMDNLSSVEAADSNPYYSSSGSFLVSKTGSTMFMFAREKFDTSIFDFADTVGAQIFCKDGFKIVFGDAVLYFDGTADEDSSTSNCTLEEIEVFGESVKLNTNFQGDHALTLQYANDCFLITDYAYGVGDTYIISKKGIWEQHNDEILTPENCNDPIITVSADTDGSLTFSCKPRKYIFTGSIDDLLKYSCGADELYSVEGFLYFDDSSPRYSIENTTTLSEKYTAEQLKDEFDVMNSFYEQFDSPDKSETLDELFDQNKSKYGMFEWNNMGDKNDKC